MTVEKKEADNTNNEQKLIRNLVLEFLDGHFKARKSGETAFEARVLKRRFFEWKTSEWAMSNIVASVSASQSIEVMSRVSLRTCADEAARKLSEVEAELSTYAPGSWNGRQLQRTAEQWRIAASVARATCVLEDSA